MFITELTRHGLAYRAHATAQEAVAYVLAELGPHYTGGDDPAFWAEGRGARLAQSPRRMLDFAAYVYPSPEWVIAGLGYADTSALPHALRLLADAIDDGTARGLT